jgi:hypothetical protein
MAEPAVDHAGDRNADTGRFRAGNFAAGKHLGRSERARENYRKSLLGEMRDLIDQALGEMQPGDAFLRDLLAAALCDVRQLDEYLTRMGGPASQQGRPYKAAEMRRSRERDALQLMDRLGVGPKARLQLSILEPGRASRAKAIEAEQAHGELRRLYAQDGG